MKRLHVHVAVPDLNEAIGFYSTVLGNAPTKIRKDYARWKLEDPPVNFAVTVRPQPGLRHLGVQVDEAPELGALRARISEAGMEPFDEGETVCCHARSDKSWVRDPAGVSWELFRTLADVEEEAGHRLPQPPGEAACCRPDDGGKKARRCCEP